MKAIMKSNNNSELSVMIKKVPYDRHSINIDAGSGKRQPAGCVSSVVEN